MRKITRLISVLLAVVLLAGALTIGASAAQPSGYWPYYVAYTEATESGDVDRILKAGDAYLDWFSQYDLTWDIASMSFNIYYYRYSNLIFEKMGDYAAAIENHKKLIEMSEYLGYEEHVINATAKMSKLDPMTEVYALTEDTSSYPYYGSRHEPTSGTYFGRIDRRDSNMKSENAADYASESIVSFYIDVGGSPAGDFSWKIDPVDNGDHVIHIALNFPQEATTAKEIVAGTHDANIKSSLQYIATLNSPVLLRIGAEMNIWENKVDPAVFKSAYIRVADMARDIAPNAALVFSTNYISHYYEADMDEFYPGDEYVDWVGVSLYTNTATSTRSDGEAAYYGQGKFCDVVLSIKETVETFGNKPIIVSEGGTGHTLANGTDQTAHAAEQVRRMFSVLNMVYPQVKGIIYFDTESVQGVNYTLSENSTVNAAHRSAVAANETLISKAGETAPVYTKLSSFTDKTDTLKLAAYCNSLYGTGVTVTYTLDGKTLSSEGTLPYYCDIDVSSLTVGSHTLKVSFSDTNGYKATKTYTLTKLMDGTVTTGNAAGLTPDSWAVEEISEAIELGLISSRFQRNYRANITRADFCELVIDLIEQKSGMTIDEFLASRGLSRDLSAFSDTSNPDILAAYALGIVNGKDTAKKLFDPNADILRREAAKMLTIAANVLGMAEPNGESVVFSDSNTFQSWSVEYISFISGVYDKVSGKAVMGGTSTTDNIFTSTGKYTRQQAYMTMLRLYRAI